MVDRARLPNFFIIGAAKAGTTALYWYLAEHPEVFMSSVKETNYLAHEIDENGGLRYGDPILHHFPITTLKQYTDLFDGAAGFDARGEASPIYLECPFSADRIHALAPGAKIICGLRDPVDRAYSDYLMYLRTTNRSFDASRDLTEGAEWMQPSSHWMRTSRYHDALLRYFERFPRENIHVFLFDDLKRNPLAVAQGVFHFLGVDAAYRPDTDTPYNVGGIPASRLLESMFARNRLRDLVEPIVPRSLINWARQLRTRNMRKAPRLPGEIRARLAEHFKDDIERTSRLIGQSLDHWLPAETFTREIAARSPAREGQAAHGK